MHVRETVRRAFSSFLAVPTALITYWLDQGKVSWLNGVRAFMEKHVFGDAEATGNLLGTIAGGVITITSITFSLLLLALQQAAGSLTHQVVDQFPRRRLNQIYFGFFVGLAFYALVTLATVDPPFNPVFGASVALLLTFFAFYILLLLIYSTISQMRPTQIIRVIHDHTLRARERQQAFLARTRRTGLLADGRVVRVVAPANGFVVAIDLEALKTALDQANGPAEITLLTSIGAYVAFHDPLADVRSRDPAAAARVAAQIADAIRLEEERRLEQDPSYGIEQLTTIAWRSGSTSQQNPAPTLAAVHALRDILSRWTTPAADDAPIAEERLPIVYPDDAVPGLLASLESLTVVASESMRHQVLAEIARTLAIVFDRLPSDAQERAQEIILRTLAGLGDHVLTVELENALTTLVATLEHAGRLETAAAVRTAQTTLAASNGVLNSRATRVPADA